MDAMIADHFVHHASEGRLAEESLKNPCSSTCKLTGPVIKNIDNEQGSPSSFEGCALKQQGLHCHVWIVWTAPRWTLQTAGNWTSGLQQHLCRDLIGLVYWLNHQGI